MILVISTCSESLSENEFVDPIVEVLDNQKTEHYKVHHSKISSKLLEVADKIIICGTALNDNLYLDHLDDFRWVKDFKKPILGICSGMQILALINGARLEKRLEIGMVDIKAENSNPLFKGTFKGYALHGNTISIKKDSILTVIASSENCIEAIKKEGYEQFGILFHPEVRNERMIISFVGL